MNQTGVRVVGGSQAEQIAVLRAQIQRLETPDVAAQVQPEVELLGVPEGLSELLPGGGLPRKRATVCAECAALVVELISHVSAAGGHVAVVGWPDLSLAQVVEDGDISRVIAVPEPGAEPWAVTSVLCEGLDLVVHKGTGELSPTRARPVLAKVRAGQAALLTVGTRLPGTAMEIGAEVVAVHGLGRGSGRIWGVDIGVRVASASMRPRRGVLTCGQRLDARPRLEVV
ncbi:hypothetical protein [Corynebacterium sp. HMSC034H07]|uniref:hypothetical protein n=1 Tax=Corynebacterium sp. HMSC034H07 TaxID=1739512 RepID=UPI0008A5D91E|nr:hypothetical protein [Corynebacterium sp. HMSC034H07]OFO96719.1 hypothetical protein HMPREF3009_05235 [Corynebacterium sp. HMSC034H07]